MIMEKNPDDLLGRVAVVTGGSRGIGKAVAVSLAERGATVYVTGRSARRGKSTDEIVGGTLEETVDEIRDAGGVAVAIQCDHSDDKQVRAVFEKVAEERGRLDILVNNAFNLGGGGLNDNLKTNFWEQGAKQWDPVHTVGLRSHYMASCFAAPLMIATAAEEGASPGLVAHISSFGGLTYTFNVAYGVGKCGVDRLANDMAVELEEHRVAVVSMWPGIVRTEKMARLIDLGIWDEMVGTPITASESPTLTGRAIAALAGDRGVMSRTGKVQVVAELAKEYGFTDIDGQTPPSIRSLRFCLPAYVFPKVLPAGTEVPLSWVPDWLIPFDYMRNSRQPE